MCALRAGVAGPLAAPAAVAFLRDVSWSREGAGSRARPDAVLERFPRASLYRVVDPAFKGYPIVIGRVVVGETFFLLAPVPNDAQRETFDYLGLVHRAAGTPLDAEFEYTGFWDLRASIAKDYQVGRGFIAGDAAHSHPPFGGFALNNGLEGIRNLGWKLAARLHGWGGDWLLGSYSEERRPMF